MSKPASKTLIGIFVLGAIALAVIGIVVLGSGKFFKETVGVVCYFEGDIKGLNVGSPVVFRGVKVGSVTNILLRFDPQTLDFKIPVFIEIEPDRIETIGPRGKKGERMKPLIDKGLRAQLEMQSFVTGQLQIALNLLPDKPAKFVGTDDLEAKHGGVSLESTGGRPVFHLGRRGEQGRKPRRARK